MALRAHRAPIHPRRGTAGRRDPGAGRGRIPWASFTRTQARLDHAVELYRKKLAPRIFTTGGAGGDPVYTEGGVGRSYLMSQGVPSEAVIVETEGESTLESTAMASEVMHRMGLNSAIVVSDGYHIFRVKKMLQSRGLLVYGSPRKELYPDALHERWNYVKQAIGYLLWSAGLAV